MNDVFDIRVEIYPETPEPAALYSFWKGPMPIVYKMPLQQAMAHLQEHLETLAEEMGEWTKDAGSGRTVDGDYDSLIETLAEIEADAVLDWAEDDECDLTDTDTIDYYIEREVGGGEKYSTACRLACRTKERILARLAKASGTEGSGAFPQQ